jgi:hypothetical protein
MSSKTTSSRSIVLALLAASALALGGCAETTSGAGYGDGYVARAPMGGAHVASARVPNVATTTPQANPPVLRSNVSTHSTVTLKRIRDTR